MELESKVTIRVPEAWHRQAKAEAALRGISLSNLVRTAVNEWLSKHPLGEVNEDGR